MIGVDTNVLLRFLVDDDPEQNRHARAFLSERGADNPAFLSAVMLAETVWVLNRSLGYSMADISKIVRDLLASDGLIIEHAHELGLVLGRGNIPSTDLADYLIAWSGGLAGCTHTVTFDRKAAKAIPSMELLA